MAKASIRLPNGTSVLIEGTTDEVRQLLEFYELPPLLWTEKWDKEGAS